MVTTRTSWGDTTAPRKPAQWILILLDVVSSIPIAFRSLKPHKRAEFYDSRNMGWFDIVYVGPGHQQNSMGRYYDSSETSTLNFISGLLYLQFRSILGLESRGFYPKMQTFANPTVEYPTREPVLIGYRIWWRWGHRNDAWRFYSFIQQKHGLKEQFRSTFGGTDESKMLQKNTFESKNFARFFFSPQCNIYLPDYQILDLALYKPWRTKAGKSNHRQQQQHRAILFEALKNRTFK